MSGHTAAVVGIGWSPDATTLYSVAKDRAVRSWQAGTGKPLKTLWQLPSSTIPAHLAVSPNGWIAIITTNGTLWLLDPVEHKPRLTHRLNAPSQGALAWSADGSVLAAGDQKGYVHLWHCPVP